MAFAPRSLCYWKLRTHTLQLGARTRIMAILNLTPDSFSGDGFGDGNGRAAIDYALHALDNGADILDLGAESTRPSATPIDAAEEQRRLLPVLRGILKLRHGATISIDTYHAATARAAAEAGAEIINDVSGLLWDSAMAAAVATTRCGLVLMHTRGRSQQWREQPALAPDEVLPLVLHGLRGRLECALAAGIAAESIVLDPGFGFGKIGGENFALLTGFDKLAALGRPLLAGISRKSFLGEAVRNLQPQKIPTAEAVLTATTAANVAAILQGAHILRVHDLQQAREAAAVADKVIQTVEDKTPVAIKVAREFGSS
jgi:dihydropteroate synthase